MSGVTVREILRRYSSYYAALTPALRERFESRLADLLMHVDFVPEGLRGDVNMEMKIVIASAQIQLTLGLDQFIPQRFKTIVVLPTGYRLSEIKKRVIGHVDSRTSEIHLSWRNVQHGFRVQDDAINVALHEFAHWLEFESRLDRFDNSLLCKFEFSDWRKVAQQKLLTIRANQNEFLKDYGGKNLVELFAVSVEAFFEQPESFKQKLPELYERLVVLLNQDPTNRASPFEN